MFGEGCTVKYLNIFEPHHERIDHNNETGTDLISSQFATGEVTSYKNLHDNTYSGGHKYGLKHGLGETISTSYSYIYT
eukprot:gene32661-40299_t